MPSRVRWVMGVVVVGAVVVPAAAISDAQPTMDQPAASHSAPAPAPAPAAASARPARPYGADISWPNCPKGMGIPSRRSPGEPMPARSARFVIVGVTNGPGFHPNPCLAGQLRWVHRHHRLLGAYALTTFPRLKQLRRHARSGPFGVTGRRAALRNTGYAEALFNLRVMRRAGFRASMIWIDVEPYPIRPWSHNKFANRAVITGAIRGYRDLGYRVGIYTNRYGWPAVVGAWRLPGYPTWSTAGRSHAHHARAMCTTGPSGGPTWLVQWWHGHHDRDLVCAQAPRAARFFQ